MTPASSENHFLLVAQFIKKSDEENNFALLQMFKNKSLEFFKFLFSEISKSKNEFDDESIERYVDYVVKILIETKRLYDLASLYAQLKHQHERQKNHDCFYKEMKTVMRRYLNDLFISSLTYRSSDIDDLFFDILGSDTPLFVELISHIFKKKKLFDAPISVNIWKKFITIADVNVKNFVETADPYFLSFYLAKLPEAFFVPEDHISKWTMLIISPTTNRKIIEKITAAMKIHSSIEILFMLMLTNKEDLRGQTFEMIKNYFKKNRHKTETYRKELLYFLEKVITSHFYDFHQISQTQKISVANLILSIYGQSLIPFISSIINEKSFSNDAKHLETKKILISLLGKMSTKDKKILDIIRNIARSPEIEEEIRNESAKVLQNTISPKQ